MNLQKEFRTLVLPLIRGLPFILGFLLCAYLLSKRSLRYAQSLYQASAAIKLDNRDLGVQNFELFENGSGKASFSNNFLTEVELFKSSSLLRKTFERVHFDVSCYRLGKVKRRELYDDIPFLLDYQLYDPKIYGRLFYLTYTADHTFQFSTQEKEGDTSCLAFGEYLHHEKKIKLRLERNEKMLAKNPTALQVGDRFAIRFNSIENLMKGINGNNLFIKPLDKEVYVVKVYYQHEIPEKAALFVNALLDTYIAEDQKDRNRRAENTLQFIDREIEAVQKKLLQAELALANFRKTESLVNPSQETDAMLRQSTELHKQRLTFDIQEVELRNVYDFLTSDQSLSGFSPDFHALEDEVLKSTYRKIKDLELERTDLLAKYSNTSIEVNTINQKIKDLQQYTLESIEKKMLNIADKRYELFQSIADLEQQLKAFPNKERRLLALQRAFQLEEQTYKILVKKRTELSVAQSSNVTFHKIIDYAKIPTGTIAPNRAMVIGGGLFVALLIGLAFAFIWNYFTARLNFVEELEGQLTLPIMATIARVKKKDQNPGEALLPLYSHLQKQKLLEGGQVIGISSTRAEEGKSTVAAGLAELLASFGKKILLLDMDYVSNAPHYATETQVAGIAEVLRERLPPAHLIQNLKIGNADLLSRGTIKPSAIQLCDPQTLELFQTLKKQYDVLLIDAAPLSDNAYGPAALQYGELNLLVLRKNKTRLRKLKTTQQILEAYSIENTYVLLNEFSAK